MSREFFADLPQGDLTPLEKDLRDLLCLAAAKAAELLPPSGEVSLQEWVEHRIPQEFKLKVNDGGFIVLAPWSKSKPKPSTKADRSQVFMDSLPAGSFMPEEEKLRNAILASLSGAPRKETSMQRLLREEDVWRAKAFLPNYVRLEEWIENRINAEVTTFEKDGWQIVKMKGPSKEERGEAVEAFFAALPSDEFTPEEERMRSAILTFLETCPPHLAHLSGVGGDPKVKRASWDLLEQGNFKVTLSQWIERRVGEEFILKQNEKTQQMEIQVVGAAPRVSKGRKGKGKGKEPLSELEREQKFQEQSQRREEFFSNLPDGEFSLEEEELRDQLFSFLDAHGTDTMATLSQAGQTEAVRNARLALLPADGSISLRVWIERRVADDFELFPHEGNGTGNSKEVYFCVHGQGSEEALAAAMKTVSKRQEQKQSKGTGKGKSQSKDSDKSSYYRDERSSYYRDEASEPPRKKIAY